MTFRHDRKNYLQRLLSAGHENIASTPMKRESCGFVFQIECLRKTNPYDFMCSCHRAFAHEAISNIGFDKLHKLNTFQK